MGRSLILFFTDKERVGVVIEEVTASDQILDLVRIALLKRQRRLALRGFQGLHDHSLLGCSWAWHLINIQ